MPEPSNKRREITLSVIAGAIAGAVIAIATDPELPMTPFDIGSGLYWVLLWVALVSFRPTLLGAAVGGATAWLLLRLNPRPWVRFSGVIAASSLAVAILVGQGWWWGFHVSEVFVQAEPPDYAGPCPATVKFVARITVEGGPGVVRYSLPREERFKDRPYEVAEGSIEFESSGTKIVTSDVTVGKQDRIPGAGGTLQIDIRQPRRGWVKAEYRVRCTSWREPERAQARPGALAEGRWTLRVPQAWRSEEIEAYGSEGTALRRPDPGRRWLELLIEVAVPRASAGLTFGEMAVVDEGGVRHTAAAIAGPAPQGLVRPRFLFLEEAFKPWEDPIRPSSVSSWSYSYEEGKRSRITFSADRRRVFSITRDGRVTFSSEKPAQLFLLFAQPSDARQFELHLGERARVTVDRISTPDWTSADLAPRAGRSAEDRKKDAERRKAQIAGWAKACDAGGVQACYGLGTHYHSGKPFGEEMPKDHLARAAAAFQKACERGRAAGHAATRGEVAVACYTLGDMVRDGAGMPQDRARSLDFYRKGCEAGDFADFKYQACWRFAKYGLEQLDRAITGYEKACDARDAAACYTLGTLYSGTLGSVANRLGEGSSHVRADALFQKACDGGNAMACYTFGRRISFRGALPQQLTRAGAAIQKACDGGIAAACTDLGEMYRAGQGVQKDEVRAADFLKKGRALRDKENCEGGLLEHCGSLAEMYERGTGVPKDLAKSAALMQKACDAGELENCAALGVMYERGSGVPKDLARAAALQKQACDAGYIGGCRNLGVMYRDGIGVPKDPVRAASLFKQICEQWEGQCADLGYMYQYGQGVPQDAARAATLYKKGCDGGDEWGCASLAWMYLTGTGVSKDEARAVTLLQQACQRGSDYACQQLKRR